MAGEDYERLKADILRNGYDKSQPIWLFENSIIDGWNRQKACNELGLTATYKQFEGSQLDAINFVMRTNKRRNLSSSQWAAIAVEAEDIVTAIEEAVEAERRAKIADNQTLNNSKSKFQTPELIPPSEKTNYKAKESAESRYKIAEKFNTNARYISDAKKLRTENPEAFEKIKRGETTITKVKKEAKKKEREQRKDIARAVFEEAVSKIETPKAESGKWIKLGRHYLYCGDNRDKIFLNALPKAKFAFSDPPYNENVMDWDKDFSWDQDYLQDFADIVAVTPGISQIYNFMQITKMTYKWSCATWITNGMTRGSLGFGNWIYIALFSGLDSIYQNKQDFYRISISNKIDDLHSHRGKKPAELMVNLIGDFTDENDIVIDNFLGSGTTLFCCEEMGRVCYAAEKDLDFCQTIINKFYYKYV